jgi:hypothetical protein
MINQRWNEAAQALELLARHCRNVAEAPAKP